MSDSDFVKFGMSSMRNISFHYIDEFGITKEEWAEMSENERDEALQEYVNQNVDAWVEEE